jgi:hypothetical protein
MRGGFYSARAAASFRDAGSETILMSGFGTLDTKRALCDLTPTAFYLTVALQHGCVNSIYI